MLRSLISLVQVIVNLIDQKGGEQAVGEAFECMSKFVKLPHLKYVAFDFHEVCKNNRYENLEYLLRRVKQDLNQYSYFLRDRKGATVSKQTGGIRTNCIDCLDRTNVVQSVFARHMLITQLQTLGILASVDPDTAFRESQVSKISERHLRDALRERENAEMQREQTDIYIYRERESVCVCVCVCMLDIDGSIY
mgnify:CR=1 FL=1